jgi:hypothetical protein
MEPSIFAKYHSGEMNVAHIDDEIIPFVSSLVWLYARIVFSVRSHVGLSSLALIQSRKTEGRKCLGARHLQT